MTNQGRVNELCRMIRGIALNYPTGMDQIVATVNACIQPPKFVHFRVGDDGGISTSSTNTEGAAIHAPEATETTAAVAPATFSPNAHHPESEHSTQKRRGPGRPKKVRTEEVR